MVHVAIEVEGQAELEQAYQNWPELVIRVADEVGVEARQIILQATAPFTPVRTGFLLKSEDVVLLDHFTLQLEATAAYASFVHARVPFLDEGAAAAEQPVADAYERGMDRLAARI